MKRQDPIDPNVASLLTDLNRKQAERATPVKERQRKTKAREKAAARNRVMLDLPMEIELIIRQLAKDEGCPMSQVATFILAVGINQMDQDKNIDLVKFKIPTRSPRFEWNLDIQKIVELFVLGTPLDNSQGHR